VLLAVPGGTLRQQLVGDEEQVVEVSFGSWYRSPQFVQLFVPVRNVGAGLAHVLAAAVTIDRDGSRDEGDADEGDPILRSSLTWFIPAGEDTRLLIFYQSESFEGRLLKKFVERLRSPRRCS
jgi:hypothetical protein